MIYQSAEELIGKTPLIKLNNIMKKYGLRANLYAKVEYFNPAGSSKDRISKSMLDNAGINKETTIIEPTSGNTGIGLAFLCAIRNLKLIIVMPENMSKERRKLIKAYGAEVVLTSASLGMSGAIIKANEIHQKIENSIILDQFNNDNNPLIHYLTTAQEIFNDLEGKIDIFVAGIGTGGTVSGVGKYLKERKKGIKIIGIEPKDSPLISKNQAGPHKIQGIGANFIPNTLNQEIIDVIKLVTDSEAYDYARELILMEGLNCGISSGASLCVGIKEAQKEENINKNIVVFLPDGGEKYLSTDLFKE